MTTRTRAPGEGCVKDYETKQGVRWFYKCMVPDPVSGEMKQKMKRGFTSKTAAAKALREVLSKVDSGTYAEPSKVTFGAYLTDWLDGLRLKPSTMSSYRKNVRLHIAPYLGSIPLSAITGPKLTALYRTLETSGRKDSTPGGLKARTVLYVHTIAHKALKDAVNADMLMINPADKAKPPTAAEARAPEMKTWSADEVRSFLGWSKTSGDPDWVAWTLAAVTGCRRGELLAIRWKDVDLDADRLSIRRAVSVIKHHGAHEELIEGTTKSGKSRVVDLDPKTVTLLKTYRTERGEISLTLRSAEALVFGTVDGTWRHPERFSRSWREAVAKYNRAHPDALLPVIHLHEIRHTSATLMLVAGEHPKVVSERIGHAKTSITLDIYSHAVPSLQRDAANRLGSVIHGAA
ncbi:MAG TPA: tyrosine-type recombinase/integrase [Actinocrinis sp.]|uniref:tyrosine-type recombinase/integrase n=1 Tax=Actinocrinis sp. TaxID=1920516 RepID=UPI002DDD7DAF|nr:tyrosine-type recombinase/integrase [Actinocrinis sp.]HEV2344338.1 tyrosine-type recombinase/integrase [Actinocrinis sp.]